MTAGHTTGKPLACAKRRPALSGAVAFAAAVAALAPTSDAVAEMVRYTLDPEHTTVAFLVEHLGFAGTLGQFTDVEGSFSFDLDALTLDAVNVVVNTASVTTLHEARDGHLRSGDFLDVDNHPTMTFIGTSSARSGDTAGQVTGNLTLLGQTHPVTLDVTLNRAAEYPYSPPGVDGRPFHIGISARTTIQRSDWGMTYGVDNGLVGDDVDIILEFEARRDN